MEELLNEGGWKVTRESAPLPDGRVKTGLRIYRADAVHIIAQISPEKILMLREFRPFYGEYIWMLPSGKADKGGSMLDTAQRELREETGYEAEHMEWQSTSNQTDTLVFSNHVFLASGLRKNPLPQDEDELIEVHEMTAEEALQKVLASPKVHIMSAYALLRYLRERS